nr:hypothetical protein [Ensifer sp. NM-2]
MPLIVMDAAAIKAVDEGKRQTSDCRCPGPAHSLRSAA